MGHPISNREIITKALYPPDAVGQGVDGDLRQGSL